MNDTSLDSLRKALTPIEDVKFSLSLNKHPKACANKSLVNALNMKISDDGVVLQNDESLLVHTPIIDGIISDGQYDKIIHIISCNTELVIFVKRNNNFDIYRYNEKSDECKKCYNHSIPYNGGKFSSTFTYTSNDSLIIAFCEYDSLDSEIMNPMMTINLGNFDDDTIFNDRDLPIYKLPICPEVSLPQITNSNVVKGKSYVGTHYFYIRYKINNYDYTQWFDFGYPIVNKYSQETILHEKVTTNNENMGDGNYTELVGAHATNNITRLTSYLASDVDIINNCISIDIAHSKLLYDYCQIGVIVKSKTYTKYLVSSDINIKDTINFKCDVNDLIEEQFNTNKYFNYFNVKTIENRKNKIYIANYKNSKDKELSKADLDRITLGYKKIGYVEDNDINPYDIENFVINNVEFKIGDLLASVRKQTGFIGSDVNLVNLQFISFAYYLHLIGYDEYVNYDFIKLYAPHTINSGSSVTGKIVDVESDYVNINNLLIGVINLPYKIKRANEIITKYFKVVSLIKKDGKLFNIKEVDGSAAAQVSHVDSVAYLDNVTYENKILVKYQHKDYTINLHNIATLETDNINVNDFYKRSVKYRNSLNNTINDKILSSLVQGEVYDFYIHFVDKYGNTTKGYRLNNNTKPYRYNVNGVVEEACLFGTKIPSSSWSQGPYLFPKNYKVIDVDPIYGNEINLDVSWIKKPDYNYSPHYIDENNYVYTTNISNAEYHELYRLFENLLLLPDNLKNTLTWGDILDGGFDDATSFIPYINSNGDSLFKLPKIHARYEDDNKDYIIGLTINNIPTDLFGYESYFISHQKLEKTYLLDGFGSDNQIENILLNLKNYSTDIIAKFTRLHKYWNIPAEINYTRYIQKDVDSHYDSYYGLNLINQIAYADDAQNNRSERNTTLYFTDDKTEINFNSNDLRYIQIINISKNKYINKNKKLYRLGNILTNDINEINEGLNGIYSKHLTLHYGDENNGVNNLTSETGYGSYGNVYCYEVFGFYDEDIIDYYLTTAAKYHTITNNDNIHASYSIIGKDVFYTTIETLTMFDYRIGNIYDSWLETYFNRESDIDFIYEFNRTILRSNVISDESRQNNWRFFETEAYKNIEENKGNITNIVSIGNYLYVHTEHSLFAFSEDNTINTTNQQLQLSVPDIFDLNYREQYITRLGFGGLQDKDSWIADKFGYLYYNKDNNEFINIYGNNLELLNNTIYEYLKYINPYQVLFAHDVFNNRIFVQICYLRNNRKAYKTLSYNYKYKTFVSLHTILGDTGFDKAYNTKENLYLVKDKYIYSFDHYSYGKDNLEDISYNKNSKVSFIINTYYHSVKYLENIIYKLRRRDNIVDTNIIEEFNTDTNRFPVGINLIPYSANTIKIFNDCVNTGELDIAVEIDDISHKPINTITNYNKPYYDLGNWNFSYLRDTNNINELGNEMSRLYGNYFVIEFGFGSNENLIEFENLDIRLSEDKNV